MVIGIFYQDITLSSRIEYVVDFINQHGLRPNGVTVQANPKEANIKVNYGELSNEAHFSIPKQGSLFELKYHSKNQFKANQYSFEALNLYSVEVNLNEVSAFCSNGRFGFDLLETIFFHISRIEEYNKPPNTKDHWDTLKTEEMFLVVNSLEKIPVVDHIMYAFFAALGCIKTPFSTEVTISHDVDHIRKYSGIFSYLKKLVGHIIRLEFAQLKKWRKQVSDHKRDGIDPYDVFEWLMDTKGKANTNNRMVFYLIGGNSVYDTPIPLEDEILHKSIEAAKENGYTIGLHPSYNSWKNRKRLIQEKTIIEKVVSRNVSFSRQHYLHFAFPQTITILEAEGIEVDSSIGFNSRIGFRCGTGFKYKLYDVDAERTTSLWELPLVFMDSALIKESKKSGSPMEKSMIRITNSFLEENKYFTLITCNFHNSRFDEAEMNDWPLKAIYQKFLNKES